MDKTLINQRFIKAVEHIISTRKERNKTLIAGNLNISKSKFSEILNERMNVSAELIALLCHHYNLNSEYVLFGECKIDKEDSNEKQIMCPYYKSQLVPAHHE